MKTITSVLLAITFGLIPTQTVQTAPVDPPRQLASQTTIGATGPAGLQYNRSMLKMIKRQACRCCKKDNGGQAGQRGGHQAIGGSPGPMNPPHNGGGGGKGGGPGEGSGNCCPSC